MSSHLTAKAARTTIDVAATYRHIRPVPQLPDFAARIDGVDLTRPLSAEVREELHQALLDFEVLFFDPQEITPDQHLELASAFGPVAQGAYFPRKQGNPRIEVIENDEKRPPSIDHWHTDLSWLPQPPAGTVIQITEVPPVGGNTSWSSMSKAFAALSPAMQAYLRSLQAQHTWEVSNWRFYLENLGEDVLVNSIRQFKPVLHPVVAVHPESGKETLFVNETFTRHLHGVSRDESKAILAFLAQWIKQPEFVYNHTWKAHGIAVWDNRSTQHYAAADYWPHRRVNQRVTFDARGTQASRSSTLELVGGADRRSDVAYGAA